MLFLKFGFRFLKKLAFVEPFGFNDSQRTKILEASKGSSHQKVATEGTEK